jgi:hypothetical protein
MPPEPWASNRQSKERFLAWVDQIGSHTRPQGEAIFNAKAHEEPAFRSIRAMQSLATTPGSERLELACRRTNAFGVGLRRLRSILATHLDAAIVESEPNITPAIEPSNLRGCQDSHYPQPSPMTTSVTEQRRARRRVGMLDAWREQCNSPTSDDLSCEDRLTLLLEREQRHRSQLRLQRR